MPNWSEIPTGATRSTAPRPPSPAAPTVPAKDENVPVSFAARKPRRSMSDLIVAGQVRRRIDAALAEFKHHEELYRDWNLRKVDPYGTGTALNFYGAPGTGKSMAAEAVAQQLGSAVLDVDYAEIESKYVGDTPKNIVACFREAERSGAVLVFNEADSILGARLSDVTQSADHSVNVSRAVMLSQLDTFGGLVVFTTNFPRNYDSAFVRRILVHVRFDLPDEATRTLLWQTLVPPEVPGSQALDFAALAAASEGLSGGDMVNAVKVAAAEAIVRTGPERAVRTGDLLAQVSSIRQAHSEVGRSVPEPPRLVSLEEVAGLPEGSNPDDH